jgi:hypothetical protein
VFRKFLGTTAMTKPQRKFKLPAVLAEWWQNLRAGWMSFNELHDGGDAAGLARDVGLSPADLFAVAAKRPDAAEPLRLRLEALHLTRAALLRTDPLVMRDRERVCSVCDNKRPCKRDWLASSGRSGMAHLLPQRLYARGAHGRMLALRACRSTALRGLIPCQNSLPIIRSTEHRPAPRKKIAA